MVIKEININELENQVREKVFTRYDAYRLNIIELVKSHKANCDDSDCNVSLILIREMCERLGITFTKEEKELFI